MIPTLFLQLFGGRVVAPPTLPANLLAAIAAAIEADGTLSSLHGRVSKDEKPATPNTDKAPYLILSQSAARTLVVNPQSEWYAVTIRMRVEAFKASDAEVQAGILHTSVLAWGALDFAGGFAIPLFKTDSKSGKSGGRIPGEKGSWWSELTYNARCYRGS